VGRAALVALDAVLRGLRLTDLDRAARSTVPLLDSEVPLVTKVDEGGPAMPDARATASQPGQQLQVMRPADLARETAATIRRRPS
jgi:hypothetical protein